MLVAPLSRVKTRMRESQGARLERDVHRIPHLPLPSLDRSVYTLYRLIGLFSFLGRGVRMARTRGDVAERRRAQIIEAAVAVIAEQGIQHLSLSAIEKKAK